MPKLRVMLVEDHALVSQGLRALLVRHYHIVATVSDGLEVMNAADKHQPDLILLDLSLPHRTGMDLLPELRALHPDTRVLVVTMHADHVVANLAMKLGAHGFVPKDSGLPELQEAIGEVMAGRHYVSPRIRVHEKKNTWGGSRMGFGRLTARQQAIVRLIGRGSSSEEIAEAMGVSVHTVHFHRRNIRRVLGMQSDAEFARYALLVQLTEEGQG